MNKKNVIIIVVGFIAIIILNGILPYGVPGLVKLLLDGLIVFICYRLLNRGNANTTNGNFGSSGAGTPPPPPAPQAFGANKPTAGKTNYTPFILIGLVVFLIVIRQYFAAICVYFFEMGDLLNFSNSLSPLVIWGFLGAIIGMIYGAIIACRKFRLDFKYTLIPIGILVVSVVVLLVNHAYFKAPYMGFTNPVVVDTAKVDTAMRVIHRRSHSRKAKLAEKALQGNKKADTSNVITRPSRKDTTSADTSAGTN